MPKQIVPSEKPDLHQQADLKLLAKMVRFKRTSLKIRLIDAASLCGVSKQAYNNVELAVDKVRVETLFKVLNGLGIKLLIQDKNETDEWI